MAVAGPPADGLACRDGSRKCSTISAVTAFAKRQAGPAAIVVAKILFSAATIWAYGLHRDELYLQQCGRHLAWGFVDHGPLVPALSFLAEHSGAASLGARALSSSAS